MRACGEEMRQSRHDADRYIREGRAAMSCWPDAEEPSISILVLAAGTSRRSGAADHLSTGQAAARLRIRSRLSRWAELEQLDAVS